MTRSRKATRNRKPTSMARLAASMAMTFILLCGAIVMIAAMAVMMGDPGRRDVKARTPVRPYGDFDAGCIDDRSNWLDSRENLSAGMEHFYDLTGVQPALCVTMDLEVDTITDEAGVEAFVSGRYDELIGHEKGVLFVYYEPFPGDWDVYYMAGRSAQGVMDQDACRQFIDLVGKYYDSDLTEDEYFGRIFSETAEQIMAKPGITPLHVLWTAVGVVAVTGGALFLLSFESKRKYS